MTALGVAVPFCVVDMVVKSLDERRKVDGLVISRVLNIPALTAF